MALAFAIIAVGVTNITNAQSGEYLNYSNAKYHIGFEYPSDWTIKEKTNRFEEGAHIAVTDMINFGMLSIVYGEDLITDFGSTNLKTAVEKSLEGSMADYSYEYSVIERPSYNITIGGQPAGTSLHTMKEGYPENSLLWAIQSWIVFIGDDRGYIISFMSPADTFDSSDVTEVRNHMINSIKFLDTENISDNSNGNKTSRFA